MSSFETFEQFWPYYVREHSKKATRMLHFVGTGAALTAAVIGLASGRRWLVAAAPVLGYGPAWIGHFFVEKNKPATFQHPLWSLYADLVMFTKMIAGTMDAEVERWTRDAASVVEENGANGEDIHADTARTVEAPQDPGSLN